MDENFRIKQAEFATSYCIGQKLPAELPMELAIVGKSNVGKSSFINAVTGNGKLARTSQQPGKTRLVNYFLINRSFYLVDLPGYGFAKASKTEQKSWGELMENYLASGRVRHVIMLIDIRHEPTMHDLAMFRYLLYYGIPYTLVATKSDKLPRAKRVAQANANAKLLGAPPYAIPFSSQTGENLQLMRDRIGQIWADCLPRDDKE